MKTSAISKAKSSNPSISSPEGSPARTCRKPENAPGLTALARAFSLSSPVLLGSLDPATCSLKTSQASLFTTQCDEWSESWPDAGTWDAGAVYELRTSEPVTFESESSLWRSPTERDRNPPGEGSRMDGHQVQLANQEIRWPTANTRDASSAARHTTETGIMHPGTTLTDAIRLWPTARAEDGESCGNHPQAQDSLTGATRNWPTPHQNATTGAGTQGRDGGLNLQTATAMWITPNARDWKSETGSENNTWNKTPNLSRQVYRVSHPAPEIPDGPNCSENAQTSRRHWYTPSGNPSGMYAEGQETMNSRTARLGRSEASVGCTLANQAVKTIQSGESRRLNPRFVEWLLGLPIGWTEL